VHFDNDAEKWSEIVHFTRKSWILIVEKELFFFRNNSIINLFVNL